MWSSFQQSAVQGHVHPPTARISRCSLPKTSHQQASLSQYFRALFQNRQALQDLVVGTENRQVSQGSTGAEEKSVVPIGS